jgi:outer membrane protein TolC
MKTFIKIFSLFISLLPFNLIGQSTIIEQYITEAIQNHHSLKQQNFVLQKSIYQLEEAKGLFLPTINFNTTYSTAVGGRQISFPVGDLVNPIYSNLNKLNPQGAPKYPEGAIPNVNEQLVPKNFYDLRFKTQMPIYNAEIKYNQKIKKELLGVQQAEIEIFKRDLVKDLKVGYFNYLKTIAAIEIYSNAQKLLKEIEKVNKSLIKNDMANGTVLIRTQNEQAKIEGEAILAANNSKNAKAYFNFLKGSALDSDITADTTFKNSLNQASLSVNSNAAENREEVKKIEAAIKVNETILALNKAYNKPKVGGILDVGSQGKVTAIDAKNAFVLLGLSFDLPIYAGNRNKLKIREQEMELAALNEQETQIKNQLLLQYQISKNSFESAINILPAKQSQIDTAQRLFKDLLKKYKENQANYIELFEAQNQITTAMLQKNIAIYDAWIRAAELERANSSFNFK